MKAIFKKKSAAIIIMVLLIVLAVLTGMNRSFAAQRNEIVRQYYSAGIQKDLDRRIEAAQSLIGLAEGQEVEDRLTEKVQEDIAALRQADSPTEQFDANSVLSGSVMVLAGKTTGAEPFLEDFRQAQERIQQSEYNERAEQYNKMRGTFPVSVLQWALFTGPLEEFR